jgi:hypothetical protein
MSHLLIERLAELADSEPSVPERGHLAECPMCTSELEAYRRVVALAGDERRSIAPPLTEWGRLRGELTTRGMILSPAASLSAEPSLAAQVWSSAKRIAAALVLVVGGTVLGRLSSGLPVQDALALNDLRFGSDPGGPSRVAVSGAQFASTASALAALQNAQREYELAARYLAVNDTATSEVASESYRARLAALDRMAETSLRELQRRPQDPIMNQVYLTTLGARNMTLEKLGSALPVGTRLTRF